VTRPNACDSCPRSVRGVRTEIFILAPVSRREKGTSRTFQRRVHIGQLLIHCHRRQPRSENATIAFLAGAQFRSTKPATCGQLSLFSRETDAVRAPRKVQDIISGAPPGWGAGICEGIIAVIAVRAAESTTGTATRPADHFRELPRQPQKRSSSCRKNSAGPFALFMRDFTSKVVFKQSCPNSTAIGKPSVRWFPFGQGPSLSMCPTHHHRNFAAGRKRKHFAEQVTWRAKPNHGGPA